MTEKFKKIDRRYVLSDSSVNVYGFRLLTAGYQADAFRKNPVGYYMHRREEGIALKWEDLRIEGDTITAIPVINLCNPRGEQTCAEAENGFLNAASVGHIVVLEHSTDPELMLPGQTGPTVTKWYNKECSLVDIPGNCNALTALYDANENELNLADFGCPAPLLRHTPAEPLTGLCHALNLPADAPFSTVLHSVTTLADKARVLHEENVVLRNDRQALQALLDDHTTTAARMEVTALLDRALEDKKLTVQLRDKLSTDYAHNPAGLRELLAAMPAYQSITDSLTPKTDPKETRWSWDDYEKNDPAGKKLKALRATDPTRYKDIFDRKFAA